MAKNTKWYIITMKKDGKKREHWVTKDEFEISFDDKYFDRASKFFKPVTKENIGRFIKVRKIKPGNANKVFTNLREAESILKNEGYELGIGKSLGKDNLELVGYMYRLDTVIKHLHEAKNEFNKQLDYIERLL